MSERKAQHKSTKSKTTSHSKAKNAGHPSNNAAKKHGTLGVTYVFECTGQGCGYRIVREEKSEIGQARYDLKCPKCHNTEFKCLGQGDVHPAPIELSIPVPIIDFDRINPMDLGSN